MKKNAMKLVLTVAAVVGSLALSGCEYSFRLNGTNQLRREDAKNFKVEKTAVEPVRQININTKLADIELLEADNYYVEIDYNYFEEEPDYKLEDGVLSFDDARSFPESYSVSFNINNSVKIYFPKDSGLDRIKLDNASGDISLTGFAADQLDVSVAYGNLAIKDASAAETDINISSGNSDISKFYTDNLKYSNSYGNSDFTDINTGASVLESGEENRSVKLSMSSGNCNISGLNVNTVDISNSYGNITCKGLFADNFESDLSSGSLKVTDSRADDMDISNSYGNVTLALKGEAGDFMLDLNTSYGSISVDGKNYDGHLFRENNGDKKIAADLSSGDLDLKFE